MKTFFALASSMLILSSLGHAKLERTDLSYEEIERASVSIIKKAKGLQQIIYKLDTEKASLENTISLSQQRLKKIEEERNKGITYLENLKSLLEADQLMAASGVPTAEEMDEQVARAKKIIKEEENKIIQLKQEENLIKTQLVELNKQLEELKDAPVDIKQLALAKLLIKDEINRLTQRLQSIKNDCIDCANYIEERENFIDDMLGRGNTGLY